MIGPEIVLVAAGCSAALCLAWIRRPGPLVAPNYRGDQLPLVLGLVVMVAAEVAISVTALERASRSGRTVVTGRVGWVAVAVALVFTAGLVDDLARGGPRGLRGHLRALAEGRLTTGLLKVVAAVAGAVIVVVVLPHGSAIERALGVLIVAGTANLFNGLDVAPGRAAKVWLLAGAGCLVAGPPWAVAVPLLGLYGAEIPAFWFDLRRRAMLGDAGANALGFAVGAGLYGVLSLWGLLGASVAVVGLNVLAETVTLTRAIDAVAPLRWLDRAGRGKNFAPRD